MIVQHRAGAPARISGDQRAEAARGAIAGIAVGGALFAFMPQIMRGVVWAVLALRPLLG